VEPGHFETPQRNTKLSLTSITMNDDAIDTRNIQKRKDQSTGTANGER
jgi:hypothetical protein